jgi:hypothetical protein
MTTNMNMTSSCRTEVYQHQSKLPEKQSVALIDFGS